MNCNTTHYRANSSSVPGDPTSSRARELVIATTDTRESNVYAHVPPLVELNTAEGARVSGWDFRAVLQDDRQRFPALDAVFARELRLPSGRVLRTEGNYETSFFLLRINVPDSARGAHVITVGDQNGNATRIRVDLE